MTEKKHIKITSDSRPSFAGKGYDIAPEHLKKVGKMKKDLSTIFKDDAGAPDNFDLFDNLDIIQIFKVKTDRVTKIL